MSHCRRRALEASRSRRSSRQCREQWYTTKCGQWPPPLRKPPLRASLPVWSHVSALSAILISPSTIAINTQVNETHETLNGATEVKYGDGSSNVLAGPDHYRSVHCQHSPLAYRLCCPDVHCLRWNLVMVVVVRHSW